MKLWERGEYSAMIDRKPLRLPDNKTVASIMWGPLALAGDIGPRREGDPAFLVASNDKARRELNWNPKHSTLNEIAQSAWKWKKTHPSGYVSNSLVVDAAAS